MKAKKPGRRLISKKVLKDLEAVLGSRLPRTLAREDFPQFKQYVFQLERIVKTLRRKLEDASYTHGTGIHRIQFEHQQITRALRKLDRLRKV